MMERVHELRGHDKMIFLPRCLIAFLLRRTPTLIDFPFPRDKQIPSEP